MIVERAGVPVIPEVGIGTTIDATLAMELGCDTVLLGRLGHMRRRSADDGRGDGRAVTSVYLVRHARRVLKRFWALASSPTR